MLTTLSPLLSTLLVAAAPILQDPAPQDTPEEVHPTAPEKVVLLRADQVVVRPGEVLENTAVLVRDGYIVAIGEGLEAPEGAEVVEGGVVCAGYIDAWSALGLERASVVDMTTAASTSSASALDGFGQRYERTWALEAGVLLVRSQAGQRAQIGGLGAVLQSGPYGTVVLDDANLHFTCGVSRPGRDDVFNRVMEADRIASMLSGGLKYREAQVEYRYELEEWQAAIAEKEAELEKDFKKAKKDREKEIEKAEEKGKEFKEERYKEDKQPKPPKYDPDNEVFARAAHGELPVIVEVHGAAEIRALLAATADLKRLRMTLSGATEALPFAEELAARNISVIVQPSPASAATRSEQSKHDLALAGALDAKGVTVLLGTGGGTATVRDLPLMAQLAIANGLDQDAAFEALTLGAARAFDMADRFGSVEVGKHAELLVLDGAPLSGSPTHVVTGGAVVEL